MRPARSGGIIVIGQRKLVVVSTNLFAIAVAAFLVVFVVVFLVFTVKYIRTRARGRGPLGMFSQPRHTFAQYDDEGEGVESNTEGSDAEADRDDQQKSG